MRPTLAVVVVGAAAAAVPTSSGIAGRAGVAQACQWAASFRALPAGWRQQSSYCALRQGGSFSAWTSATSWRYRGDVHGPVAQLRPGRILISVILSRPPQSATFKTLGHLPLRLTAPDEVATEEGEPQIPQYRFLRTVPCQYNLDVRVDFDRPHPTSTMKRDAQRALNGLTLPRWTRRC